MKKYCNKQDCVSYEYEVSARCMECYNAAKYEPKPEADRPEQIPAVVRSNQALETNEEGLIFCPFNNTEKGIGHNPYIDIVDGFYHACCTCGAMGPMMANRKLAIKSWNNRA